MINKKILEENIKKFFRGVAVNNQTAVLSRKQKIRQKICEKYSLEDEIALINNYNLFLSNKNLVQYEQEYLEYLQFRDEIKQSVQNI